MKLHPNSAFALTLLLALPTVLNASIINVPDDFPTVQAGINAAHDGDTVLVQPGRYIENILFNKFLTVASLYLTEQDEDYIASTILDANGNGQVVKFDLRANGNALLSGFTITNGRGSTGSGIHCNTFNPIVSHCRIVGNEAEQYGGGIYARSNLTIRNCLVSGNSAGSMGGGIFYAGDGTLSRVVITDNECSQYGGGIYLTRSNARVEYCAVTSNRASSGGGIYCTAECEPTLLYTVIADNFAHTGGGMLLHRYSVVALENCTLARNRADSLAGGLFCVWASGGVLHNTIFWDNQPGQIVFHPSYAANSVSAAYCDFQGGQDSVQTNENGELIWGDGNFDNDPLFLESDDNDYHLRPGSPCVDTGDPGSQQDADQTCADVGAFPLLHRGALRGYVYDSLTDLPLPGAFVGATYGYADTTDDNGYWEILDALNDPVFDLTASKPGFLDSTLFHLQLRPLDTLDARFSLFHPVFTPSPRTIYAEVAPGESVQRQLTIDNPGNWRLEWELARGVPGVESQPWDLLASHPVSRIVGDERVRGVAFTGDRFYVTGDELDTNFVYVLDRDMNLLNRFPQFGAGRRGLGDLTWDGELLWGSGEWSVYGFTPDGVQVQRWRGPTRYNEALAWDPDRQWLWIAEIEGSIITGVDRDGVRQGTVGQSGLKIYGLEYWPDDPDGYNLYAFHSPDGEAQMVTKINPVSGDTMFVQRLQPEGGGSPQGAFITTEYVQFTTVFMTVADIRDEDRVDVWFLNADPTWLTAAPVSGVIQPGESQAFDLGLSAARLDSGIYRGELRFTLPEVHHRIIIPAELWVGYSGVGGDASVPAEFGLTRIYPNPFNASLAVSYQLSAVSQVKLHIYDISGRLVQELAEGWQTAGEHRATINGAGMASGVYLIKLTAGKEMATRKVVCVK